jgi:hydrogenase nickel incorporation protein HypA/HybF
MDTLQAAAIPMHELALSEQIVQSALRACGEPSSRMTAVAVEVGALSSVSPSALEFCLRTVLDSYGLQRAEAQISFVPARVRCRCGHEYETEDMFAPCPRCGEFMREIIEGDDVVVLHIEVEDGED